MINQRPAGRWRRSPAPSGVVPGVLPEARSRAASICWLGAGMAFRQQIKGLGSRRNRAAAGKPAAPKARAGLAAARPIRQVCAWPRILEKWPPAIRRRHLLSDPLARALEPGHAGPGPTREAKAGAPYPARFPGPCPTRARLAADGGVGGDAPVQGALTETGGHCPRGVRRPGAQLRRTWRWPSARWLAAAAAISFVAL